jgi:monoamine oxidase
MTMAVKECEVAVVGAGFAGLAAATLLKQHGADVVVLEASHRVGGRAHTVQMTRNPEQTSDHTSGPGCSVELGATWINGIGGEGNPNPILSIAAQAGLMPLRPKIQKWWDSKYVWMPLHGEARICDTKSELITIHTTAQAYAEAMEGIKLGGDNGNRSVGDALSSAWSQFSSSISTDEELKLAKAAWQWREGLQRAMDGCESTEDMSAVARGMYSEYEGSEEHAPVSCGYQSVAQTLALKVCQTGNRILFGHEVERIEYGSNDKVILQCGNGESVKAMSAIVTVSLGVLKARHATMFSPPLPNRLVEAIERLRIGTVDKLIIDFSVSVNSNISYPSSDYNDAGEVFSYSFLQERLLSENSARDGDWTRGIFSFRLGGPEFHDDSSTSMNGSGEEISQTNSGRCTGRRHSYAVIWLTGESAREMETKTEAGLLVALQSWYARTQPAMKLPSGLDWSTARVIRSRWGDDPLFRGSYSYIGADGNIQDVLHLSNGIFKQSVHGVAMWPAVLFAGEACHPQYIVSLLY